MKVLALAALVILSGCATVSPDAIRERQMTKRYAICMKQTLGPFGVFAAPSSRQRASETCGKLMHETDTPAAS